MKRYNNQYPKYMNDDSNNLHYDCNMPIYDSDFYDSNYVTKGMQEPMDEDEEYDENENENENDRRYMISLYPELSKRIQNLVEDECNKLEYEGSLMYEEYPDKKEIDKIVMRIYVIVEKDQMIPKVTQDVESQENNIGAQQVIVPGRNIWLWDNIQVPFLNELFYRRRRRFPRRFIYPYQPRPYPRYRPRYYPYYPYQPYQPYQPYVPYYYRNY